MLDLYAVRLLIFFISKSGGMVQDLYAVRLLIFFISKSGGINARSLRCEIVSFLYQ